MSIAARILLSISIVLVPLVLTWVTFGWESPLSKGLPFIALAILGWALAPLHRYRGEYLRGWPRRRDRG